MIEGIFFMVLMMFIFGSGVSGSTVRKIVREELDKWYAERKADADQSSKM